MPFDGLSVSDDFPIIGEDISDTILRIAMTETPILNLLASPEGPATSVLHQWGEESLGPDRIVNSTAINSATANTGFQTNGLAHLFQVGDILELESPAGTAVEQVTVASVPGPNSLLVTRNFGGVGINSLAAGGTLFNVGTAALDGSETSGDQTRPRTRRSNYTQIFKKTIAISGSRRAEISAPNVGDEFEHQVTARATELVRDLEKVMFLGRLSGNSIGTETALRTMSGLRQFISTAGGPNSVVPIGSMAGNPAGVVNDFLAAVWATGARDIDVIAVGSTWKRYLSEANLVRTQVTADDTSIRRLTEFYVSDFGTPRLILTPWLPAKSMMGIATRRAKMPPLRGRSFFSEQLGKTGDNTKGHVIGEYTLEVHHPDKMFYAVESTT